MDHNICNSTEFTSFSHGHNYTYSNNGSDYFVFVEHTDYFVSDKNLAKEMEKEIPVLHILGRKYLLFFLTVICLPKLIGLLLPEI